MTPKSDVDKIKQRSSKELDEAFAEYELELKANPPQTFPFDPSEFSHMSGKEFYLAMMSPESQKTFPEIQYRALFCEVVKREPHNIHGFEYDFGDLSKVMDEQGKVLAVDRKHYIFQLEKVDLSAPHPVLIGSAREYNMHNNNLSSLELKLTLYFAQTPTFKREVGFGCA